MVYGVRLEAGRGAKVPPQVRILWRPPIYKGMFEWIKSWWNKKKEPEKVVVQFSLPDGKKFGIEAIKLLDNPFGCKKHPDYVPVAPPINNCNDCWEYYSKGHVGKWGGK